MPQWLTNSITTVSDTSAQRVLRLRIWYNSTQGVSDGSNSFTVSGSWPSRSGSVSISVPGSGGQGASQVIYDEQITVSKQYGSTVSRSFSASLSGIEYWGAGQTIRTSGSATVPARPYVAPTAPGAPSVSRSSDTRHSLSWSRNATTAGPYTSQRVQRSTRTASGWSGWQTIANVSGTATSYTDSKTAANRIYQWRIQAVNSAGSRSSGSSGWVYTTPAAPSSVVASKLASGDIRVRITPSQVSPNVNFQIQHSTNNGSTWSALATVSGGTSAQNYTHVSPNPAQTHRYRVWAVISASGAVGHGLASGYRTSANIQLAAPPNAPTGLGPAGPRDPSEPITVRWTHNPVDTSDQSAYEIRWRDPGPAWNTTGKITSEISEHTFAADFFATAEIPEWEVRTWGQHEDPSDWSAAASFPLYDRPTASIDFPEDAETLTDSTLTASWSYFQFQFFPQSSWRATLLRDGSTVEVKSGSGTTDTVAFDTPGADGESYTIRIEVQAWVGLWSEPVEVTFDVEYLPPGPVHITDAQWDRNSGTMVLALDPGDWDGITTVEPIAVTVHRSNDGGDTWEVVESEIPLGAGIASLVDTVPPTRGELLYRATAISALPSIAIGEPVAITINETAYAYLGYGPGFSNILTFYGNLKRSTTAARHEVIEHFAGRVGADNRPAGVIISGETRTRDFSVNATLVMADGMATAEDFEEAAFHGGVMCLRTPDGVSGRRVFGMISPVATTSEFAPLEGVQFTISETERG